MKYILVDQSKTDSFDKEFDDLNEAIRIGNTDFGYLTDHDKKQRTGLYLLESVNPDESAENHYDGEIIKKWI